MTIRRRFAQLLTLNDRLEQEAARLRSQACNTPPGTGRDQLLRKASQLETATHIDEWLSSSGLRAPH